VGACRRWGRDESSSAPNSPPNRPASYCLHSSLPSCLSRGNTCHAWICCLHARREGTCATPGFIGHGGGKERDPTGLVEGRGDRRFTVRDGEAAKRWPFSPFWEWKVLWGEVGGDSLRAAVAPARVELRMANLLGACSRGQSGATLTGPSLDARSWCAVWTLARLSLWITFLFTARLHWCSRCLG
jgi:hypothetical protein